MTFWMYLWTENNGYRLVPFAIFILRKNIHSFQKQKKKCERLDVSQTCLIIRRIALMGVIYQCWILHTVLWGIPAFLFLRAYMMVFQKDVCHWKWQFHCLPCDFLSLFFKIITLSYLLENVNILTALKFNGISACLSIELDLSFHW